MPVELPDELVRLLDALEPCPAYVLGPRWDFLAWNDAQRRLHPPIDALAAAERNLVWLIFADPDVRAVVLTGAGDIFCSGIDLSAGPAPDAVVVTLQDRAKTLLEMAEGAKFYYRKPETYEEAAAAKFLTEDKRTVLELLISRLSELSEFTLETVEAAFQQVLEETGLKLGKVGPTVRVALTGGTVSPGIFDVVAVLGRERVVERLEKALASLDKNH